MGGEMTSRDVGAVACCMHASFELGELSPEFKGHFVMSLQTC